MKMPLVWFDVKCLWNGRESTPLGLLRQGRFRAAAKKLLTAGSCGKLYRYDRCRNTIKFAAIERPGNRRLALALALSLAAHLLTWGGYEAGKEFGWWQVWHWPTWLQL